MTTFKSFLSVLFITAFALACSQGPSFFDRSSGAQDSGGSSVGAEKGQGADQTGQNGSGDPNGDKDQNGKDDKGDKGGDPVVEDQYQTKEMSFAADTFTRSSVTASLAEPYQYTHLVMERQYQDQTKRLYQNVRPAVTDTFTQGNSGYAASETFKAVVDRVVDILIVVDNSPSMEEEQVNLAQKMMALISVIQDADWRIAVTTTDPNDVCLRGIINKADADAQTKFYNAVHAGDAGTGHERGILKAVRSLPGQCANENWVRPNSTLAVLIVSDEDNCSDGYDCRFAADQSASYLTNHLASMRQLGLNTRVYGLVWHPSMSQAQCPTGYNHANIYMQAVTATNGTWGSICDTDYTVTLQNISRDIMSIIEKRFTLGHIPDSGTMHVFVNGVETSTGFHMNGNIIEFDAAPTADAQVRIDYRYNGSPIVSTFTLSYSARPEELVVDMNGATVQPTEYIYDQAQKKITFVTVPPERASIVASYKKEVPMLTQFAMGSPVKPGTMKVALNGAWTTAYVIDETKGIVTMNATPPEGAELFFSYTAVGNPILSYAFSLPSGAAPTKLLGIDAITGATMPVSYSGGALVFNNADFVEGRQVTVRYYNEARSKTSVQLPVTPMVPSVVATAGGVSCGGKNISVTPDNLVIVKDCGFPDSINQINVLYDYVSAHTNIFTFPEGDMPAADVKQEWHVFIDDQETTDYTQQTNVFTVSDADLSLGSEVKVTVKYKVK